MSLQDDDGTVFRSNADLKGKTMTEIADERLATLETEVKRLKTTVATGQTIVGPIAGIVAFLVYVGIVGNLPLPAGTEGARVGVGVASGIAGFVVLAAALIFVQFALRALIEVAVVVLCLLNALVGVFAWAMSGDLARILAESGAVAQENLLGAVFVLTAAALFVVDLLCGLVLYPLAKVSGSNIFD